MQNSSIPRKSHHLVETLESRIAPASLLTYVDVDGDIVKISSTKGTLAGHATFSDVGAGHQLLLLDLTDKSFVGTSVSFSVKRVAGGDGVANVTKINAAGNDLNRIVVRGDLGEIDAGDGNAVTPAIRSLVAYSMGAVHSSAGATPTTEPQHAALADLVGDPITGVTGVLSSVLGQLGSVQLVKTLSSEAGRVLATLGSDVQALLSTVTDESGGPLKATTITGTARQMLENLATDLGKVGSLPLVDQALLGTALPGGLASLQAKLEICLDTPIAGLSGGVQASLLPGLTLPGITLPTLPGLTLPGLPVASILDGVLGLDLGSLPPVLVTALHGVDTALANILGNGETLAALPSDVQALLGGTVAKLSSVLGNAAGLGPELMRDLASLQANVASLASTAGAIPGFLTEQVTTQLNTLQTALVDAAQKASGGPAETAAVTSDIMGGISQLNIRGNVSNIFVNVHGNVTSARIGGSLTGGDATNGGELFVSGNLRVLTLVGSLVGGDALNSGCVEVGGKTGRIAVRGSVIGGSDTHTGAISLHGDAQAIVVCGDLSGHAGLFSGSVVNTNGMIQSLEVRGSVIGADIDSSAAISASKEIKSLRINRGVWGDAEHGVGIAAGGQQTQSGLQNYAFRDIRIGGTVQHTELLAGYSSELAPVNGSAQVRSLLVTGDWHASSLSAGVADHGAEGFGDSGDRVFETRTAGILSSIASIQIRGSVTGTADGNDQFGFVASNIGAVTIGKSALPLHPTNADGIALAQATGDVMVREVRPMQEA